MPQTLALKSSLPPSQPLPVPSAAPRLANFSEEISPLVTLALSLSHLEKVLDEILVAFLVAQLAPQQSAVLRGPEPHRQSGSRQMFQFSFSISNKTSSLQRAPLAHSWVKTLSNTAEIYYCH